MNDIGQGANAVIRDILAVLGSALWMVLKFMFILALSLGGLFGICSALFFPFFWEGAIRLGAGLACGGIVFLILRRRKEKEEEA